MNKNILVATFSALALNATYAEDIYLQDIEWNNTTVTYNADECLTAKSGLSGIPSYGGATFYSYNFDNPESPLNVSGNSTITINPENIDTTQYENIQISIMLNYTTINFDLSIKTYPIYLLSEILILFLLTIAYCKVVSIFS